jgi:hypothetical protein
MKRKVDRLLEYLEFKGITENRATTECQLSQGLIYQAKSGKADLGARAIEKILATYTDLNRVWLLTGEGAMLTAQSRDSKPELVAEHKPQLSNVEILLRDMLAEKEAKIDVLQERINELIEENARLKTLIEGERKGGAA